MAKSILGEMIAKYRKEAGMTQEELGRRVGVSTQAVSRWECGGTPDVELLPAIADCLQVSIDALYGREGGEAIDLKKLLYQRIQNAPKERCMEEVTDYIWVMQCAAMMNGIQEMGALIDFLRMQVTDRETAENPELFPEQILLCDERSCMLYGMVKDRRFAAVIPEPERGFASLLKKPEEYIRLFTLLCKPHYLEMLIDIERRKPKEHFTERSAAVRLGIPEEKAKEILDELYEHLMVERMEVVDETGSVGVYNKSQDVCLLATLFFCGSLMRSSGTMCMNADIRQKPMLHDKPGTGSLSPEWKLRESEETE